MQLNKPYLLIEHVLSFNHAVNGEKYAEMSA
jgi:hypothetical protein